MFVGCLVRFSSLGRTSFMAATSKDHSLYMSATSCHSVRVIACQMAFFPYSTWLFLDGWVTRWLSSSSQPRTYSAWWRKTHLRGKNSLAKKLAARWRMEQSLLLLGDCNLMTNLWFSSMGGNLKMSRNPPPLFENHDLDIIKYLDQPDLSNSAVSGAYWAAWQNQLNWTS